MGHFTNEENEVRRVNKLPDHCFSKREHLSLSQDTASSRRMVLCTAGYIAILGSQALNAKGSD